VGKKIVAEKGQKQIDWFVLVFAESQPPERKTSPWQSGVSGGNRLCLVAASRSWNSFEKVYGVKEVLAA